MNFEFSCTICGKEFKKFRYSTEHYKTHANSQVKYQCAICDKVLKSEKSLKNHY